AVCADRASGAAAAAPSLLRSGELRPACPRPADVRTGGRGGTTLPAERRVSRRRWILLGGVVVLIAIVVVLRGTATGDSPEHGSASDAGTGTSAVRLYAETVGHAPRAGGED